MQTPLGGPAVIFDGSAYLSAITLTPTATQDLIFVAVIKPTRAGLYHNLFDNYGAVPMLWVDPTNMYEMNINYGTGRVAAGTTGVAGWDVVICDFKNNKLYVNSGTSNGNGQVGYAFVSVSLTLTMLNRAASQVFRGAIAEMRFYNDRAGFNGDFLMLYEDVRSTWLDALIRNAGSSPLKTLVSNLAYSGNGFAKAAVASSEYVGPNDACHQYDRVNDGYYGNCQSWIGALEFSCFLFSFVFVCCTCRKSHAAPCWHINPMSLVVRCGHQHVD
jgi:hypothetical protein